MNFSWNIGYSLVPAFCFFAIIVIIHYGLKRTGKYRKSISYFKLFFSLWMVCFLGFLILSEQLKEYVNMLAGALFLISPLFYLFFRCFDKVDNENAEEASQQENKKNELLKRNNLGLELLKYLKRLHFNANIQQRIVVAIIVPAVMIILSYGFIDFYANKLHYPPWYITPIEDFDKTWWMWSVSLILIGIFEFFWLKTPKR